VAIAYGIAQLFFFFWRWEIGFFESISVTDKLMANGLGVKSKSYIAFTI
jgi:hypothetical protein